MKKSGFAWFCYLLLCIFSWSCLPAHTYAFAYVNSAHHQEEKGRTQKIYLDKEFGNADVVAIQDALTQWQYALNGYITFETLTVDLVHGSMDPLRQSEAGQAWLIMKIDSQNPLVVFHDKPQQPALAFCEAIGGHHMYLVRNRLDNDSVKGVVMHEIGHLLGAEHRREDGLMDPIHHDYDSQCIDRGTLEQVAAYQHLPFVNMNYCIYVNDQEDKTVVIIKYIN